MDSLYDRRLDQSSDEDFLTLPGFPIVADASVQILLQKA